MSGSGIIIPQLTPANGSAYYRQVSSTIERVKYLIDNDYRNEFTMSGLGSFWLQTFRFYGVPDQPDDNYDVFLSPVEITGNPNTGSLVIEYVEKSVAGTGFFVSFASSPGLGDAVTWRWKLMRWV